MHRVQARISRRLHGGIVKQKRLLIGVLVALTLAPAASAAVDPAWDPMAQQVAHDYWGGNPPCGPPHLDHSWTDGSHSGAAFILECRIGIDVSRFDGWAGLCSVVTHEYGHLFGHDHEPETIMDGDVLRWDLVPGCGHEDLGWLVLRPAPAAAHNIRGGVLRGDGWVSSSHRRRIRTRSKLQRLLLRSRLLRPTTCGSSCSPSRTPISSGSTRHRCRRAALRSSTPRR